MPLRRSSIAALMGLLGATLAMMSALHLGGILTGRSKPFDPTHAGIAEAVIGIVLAGGAIALLRVPARERAVALAAVAFAILGFAVGLNFTIRGGEAIDIAYHATVLPLLLLTLAALLRDRRHSMP